MCDKKEKQLELDKRYLRMAAVWAENSYCKRRQVGALIVKDQMIISDGYIPFSRNRPRRLSGRNHNLRCPTGRLPVP